MKYTFFALTSSALIAFASAWTTPVGDQPQGNPIGHPGLGEIVPAGKPYTITWTPTSAPDTVTLLFLKGPSENVIPQFAIAEKIPNTGSYTFTVPADTVAGPSGYGIQLIDDVTGFYQYSTQFGISNDVVSSSSSSSSTSSTSASSISSSSSSSSSSSTVVLTSSSSSTSSAPVSSTTAVSSSSSSSASAPFSIQDATTVVHTNIVTITSCGPTVTNCPAKSIAPVSSSVPAALPSSVTYWSNSTLATATTTKGSVASTGFGVSTSATASPSQFTGAGERIRVGCAMGAVLVAALALAL